ncbi:short-chain alcohol dehydrogenase [Cladophialophora chaetospira]|uniref:Short-chain alcohol dehydrogenase n=1 Tax=Cladophialophora chaetospira TaxID=386627 RepID=A0AA38XCH1_9EURO|nr:short-chain alcohol dehydrogenase [Cladophialophora chaetospira]
MFYKLRAFWSQSFGIPTPPLTEKNLPDQTGKVFLVTGSNTGVGYQVASILYAHNAKVWVAARTESKALAAIEDIKKEHPKSQGKLEFLYLNLSDLTTIKASAEDFLSREDKLHWLNNNAGVMTPPPGSKGAQGSDLTYQTNILGPFLFTKLLLPILKRTAENEPKGSVRVSWAGSLAVDLQSPNGGAVWTKGKDGEETLDGEKDNRLAYGVSKAANYFFGTEFGKRFGDRDGVLHNSYNPGNLASELQRHVAAQYPTFAIWLLHKLLYPVIYGAYTEIYSGLAPELTLQKDQGGYIIPWGREGSVRPDLIDEAKKESGQASRLFEWCERVTKEFA